MATPKKRSSTSRKGMRRAHDFLTATYAVLCPGCGEPVIRHRACMKCGEYRGKKVLEVPAAN